MIEQMRRLLSTAIIIMLVAPIFPFSVPSTQASSVLAPLTPHEVRVLVVSPANLYSKGGHYLVSDLAGYGFNVTQHTSDYPSTDYLADPKTANLDQYDVVILHGSNLGLPPTSVAFNELRHFTNYGGVLVAIGNALFVNETTGALWDDIIYSDPIQVIEQRFGVVFDAILKDVGASEFHNSGTFYLTNASIPGLPTSMDYVRGSYAGSQTQMALETWDASQIYNFTTQNGKTTSGVTFYRNASGAVGIYIQGAYIYAEEPGSNQISYFGIADNSKRTGFLSSLIAFALQRDIDTIIKPQPLANVKLDGVGAYFEETYLNASLSNFNSIIDAYNVTPTIGFVDFLVLNPDYWQQDTSLVLSQLKGKYADWEYSTNLRYYEDPRNMTKDEIEALLLDIERSYSELGIDLFSTVIAPNGRWNQTTLDAMASKQLYLMDIFDTDYSDWWRTRVNSSVVVHSGSQMMPERGVDLAENFTFPGLDKDSIQYSYFSRRDGWALAVLNGFPSFGYYVPNFRWNEVGAYSLRTVIENLSSEIADIRFVSLREAGLYFGNHMVHIRNATRSGPVIEFDIDSSSIPSALSIGKGMLWLRVNANESIQEVSIDNNQWSYFDEHSIRMPAPGTSVHVKVTLGELPSPRVIASEYKVVEARYDGYRLNVSIVSAEALNVSVLVWLPQIGRFSKDGWNVFCLEETRWDYNFSKETRILRFSSISDGFVSFEVGVFWTVEQTTPLYNSDVTIKANFTELGANIREVILSYSLGDSWINVTATLEGESYVAVIPAMSYGAIVQYKLFVGINNDKWLFTETFRYDVIDNIAPVIGDDLEWTPPSPLAGQPVNVSVTVSEPNGASGIKRVALYYYFGDSVLGRAQAQSIEMRSEAGNWTAEIPGQSGGSVISFYVFANDTAGNFIITSTFKYSVWILPIPLWLAILISGAIVAAVIGVAVYLTRIRKTKPKSETHREEPVKHAKE